MDKQDLLLEQWKAARELHQHIDDMAWRTLNYFVALNGLLISALIGLVVTLAASEIPSQVQASQLQTPPVQVWSNLAKPLVAVVMPLLGAVISFVWWAAQGRLQGYHQYRQRQARQIENTLEEIREERTLDLYRVGLDEQKLVRVRLYNKIPAHTLVVWLAFSLTLFWLIAMFVLLLYLVF